MILLRLLLIVILYCIRFQCSCCTICAWDTVLICVRWTKEKARPQGQKILLCQKKSPCNHVGGPRWVADNQLAEILRSGVISSLLWSRIKLATVCRNGKCLLWTIATRGLELVQRVDTQGRRGGMCSKEGTKSSGKWTTLKQVREENYIHVKNCFKPTYGFY